MTEQKNNTTPNFVTPTPKGKNAEFTPGTPNPNAVGGDVPTPAGNTGKDFAATTPGTPIPFTNNPNNPNKTSLTGNVPPAADKTPHADTNFAVKPGNPKAV
jgi:hypothetical protein